MFPDHKYGTMLVTGSLHCVIGVAFLITAIVQLTSPSIRNAYAYGAIVASIWILVLGSLGIAAGIKRLGDERIRQIKTVYMVISIWSIINFAGAIVVFAIVADLEKKYEDYIHYETRMTFFRIHIAFLAIELILSIVSSVICCCFSPTPRTPGIIIQYPHQQIPATVQSSGTPLQQFPINTTITNETLQNGVMVHNPPPYTSYPIQPYNPNPSDVLTLTETPTEPNSVTKTLYTKPNPDITQPQ